MSPTRSLASLPDVVLRNILSYLLVDTPRESNRTAVLVTCSTLYELGVRYLYTVVDIVATPVGSFERLTRHLTALFGEDIGLLTSDGRFPELGRTVVQLRVGEAMSRRVADYEPSDGS